MSFSPRLSLSLLPHALLLSPPVSLSQPSHTRWTLLPTPSTGHRTYTTLPRYTSVRILFLVLFFYPCRTLPALSYFLSQSVVVPTNTGRSFIAMSSSYTERTETRNRGGFDISVSTKRYFSRILGVIGGKKM